MKIKLLILILFFTNHVWSQNEFDLEEEGPPQEPPFTKAEEVIPTADQPVSAPVNQRLSNSQNQETEVKRRELIKHPDTAKGLVRIEKDGTYIYRPNRYSSRSQSSSFKIGMIDPVPNISGSSGTQGSQEYTSNYVDVYSNSKPTLLSFEYEWMPFTSMGKFGIVGSLGVFSSHGHGRFLEGDYIGQEAREKFTFYGVPAGIGGVYRLELKDRQWLVPAISGGASIYMLLEQRDDKPSSRYVGVPAFWGAGALLFNVAAMDQSTGFILDSEYGIANLWLVLEYKYVKATRQDIDISSNIYTLGFTTDF